MPFHRGLIHHFLRTDRGPVVQTVAKKKRIILNFYSKLTMCPAKGLKGLRANLPDPLHDARDRRFREAIRELNRRRRIFTNRDQDTYECSKGHFSPETLHQLRSLKADQISGGVLSVGKEVRCHQSHPLV